MDGDGVFDTAPTNQKELTWTYNQPGIYQIVARLTDADGATVTSAPIGVRVDGPKCAGQHATLVGTKHDDILIGTPDNDVIVGRGGNDLIKGKGDDDLRGGRGDDDLYGGKGDDALHGGQGNNDNCKGGRWTDTAQGCAFISGVP